VPEAGAELREWGSAKGRGLPWQIGIDVGGTFVDIVAIGASGEVKATKVETQPRIFSALEEGLAELGIAFDEVELIAHGTTIATNALVEKSGARSLLLTTRGFRDILEIRRTNKGDLFDLHWAPPPPIIDRAHRLEVDERVSWTGDVLRPLDLSEVDRIVRIVDKRGIESVAIVFLHSYVNPAHEKELRETLLKRRPGLHISISSDVVPSYREFERTTTTAANAYIAPVVARYIDQLVDDLESAGSRARLLIMQSNGGLCSVEACKHIPAKTVRSGPAGGTVGLAVESSRIDRPHMIGLDIGGTTADVSMVLNHQARWRPFLRVEFGLPILFPTIDIVSIGAGGGTIAWIDKGGALRAGPASAGAVPGPACYAKGGEEPTSTDAQLVLGRLTPESFLGGKMVILPEFAERAIEEKIATPLGLSLAGAAAGIVEILTNNMIQSVRLVTIERGYDPRDFSLCAFGGSGPLFAAEIARDLGIPNVIVPQRPGVFSASGMLAAEVVHDASQTVVARLDALSNAEIEAHFKALERRVLGLLGRRRTDGAKLVIERYADMLYAGQTHSLPVRVSNTLFSDDARSAVLQTFHTQFEQRFGHSDPNYPVEVLDLRVFGRCPLGDARPRGGSRDLRRVSSKRFPLPKARQRQVYFGAAGGYVTAAIYSRDELPPGARLQGPAVVEQSDTTTIIPPLTSAVVDERTHDLVIRVDDR
jgi:N-methylhydantoinase A